MRSLDDVGGAVEIRAALALSANSHHLPLIFRFVSAYSLMLFLPDDLLRVHGRQARPWECGALTSRD